MQFKSCLIIIKSTEFPIDLNISLNNATAVILDCRRVRKHQHSSPAHYGSGDGDLSPDGHVVRKLRQQNVLQRRNSSSTVLMGDTFPFCHPSELQNKACSS